MPVDKPKILVVDDEDNIRDLLRLYLENEGFAVEQAAEGPSGLRMAQAGTYTAVILDVMLPGMDGLSICRALRAVSPVPIIMLTARGDEADKILGLEYGADDYLTKPFSPRELLARVKAVLRRTGTANAAAGAPAGAATPAAPGVLRFTDFALVQEARELHLGGQVLTLPNKEFDLLWLLASHPRRVFTREQLLQQVWEYDFMGDTRTVDVHVRRLRAKIEPNPEEPRYLVTVWRVGYKFEGEPVRG